MQLFSIAIIFYFQNGFSSYEFIRHFFMYVVCECCLHYTDVCSKQQSAEILFQSTLNIVWKLQQRSAKPTNIHELLSLYLKFSPIMFLFPNIFGTLYQILISTKIDTAKWRHIMFLMWSNNVLHSLIASSLYQ